MSEINISELSQLLFEQVQLMDGFKMDDESWSDWDESVRIRTWEMYLATETIIKDRKVKNNLDPYSPTANWVTK